MLSAYPAQREDLSFPEEKAEFEAIMDIIKSIRNVRAEMNVAPAKRLHVTIKTDREETLKNGESYLAKLAGVESIVYDKNYIPTGKVSSAVTSTAAVFIPLGDLIDYDKEGEF